MNLERPPFHLLPAAPATPAKPYVFDIHGVRIQDDYAWLKAENWREVLKDPTVLDPAFNVRTEGDTTAAADYFDRIKLFAFNGQDSTSTIAAGPCVKQTPFDSIGSPNESSDYLHVYPQP